MERREVGHKALEHLLFSSHNCLDVNEQMHMIVHAAEQTASLINQF